MRSGSAALLRAFGAIVVMAVLVLGVPALLIATVGNPLPSDLPSLHEIRILLTQNGQGFTDFLLGSLAVMVWVVWAQLMVALVVEVVATMRHTETRRLAVLPGLQGVAARLIAAITLATLLASGPVATPIVGALSFNDAIVSSAAQELVIDRGTTVTEPAMPAFEAGVIDLTDVRAMTVQDQTELWDLADAAYGDGVSWKRIAQANAGRIDADGHAISADTEVVASGTELVLPGPIDTDQVSQYGILADRASERSQRLASSSGHGLYHVETGDSMWNVAQQHVTSELGRPATQAEVAEYWANLVASNRATASGDADLIYPGEMLVMPGGSIAIDAPLRVLSADGFDEQNRSTTNVGHVVSDGPVDARSTADGEPHPSPSPSPSPSLPVVGLVDRESAIELQHADTPAGSALPDVVAIDTSDDQSSRVPALGLVAFGSAMLSAGVVGALRRRRDAQRRTRPAGTMARPSSPEAAAFEAAMLHASHELQESTLGLGWRALPASAVTTLRIASPDEVHGSGQLVVARTEAAETQEPIQVEPTADPVVKTTSLVVGTEPESGDAVLLELEPATLVELVGSSESIRRFVRSAVLDLGVSDRADDICVVAVAAAEQLDDLERVETVVSYRQALAHIVRTGNGSPDETTPVVVVSVIESDDEHVLADLLLAGATVIAPGVDSAVGIHLDGDCAVLQPSGTVATLAAFTDRQYRSVVELIETTSPAAIELVDPVVKVHEVLDVSSPSECVVEPGPIEVKVLGPVEVCGASRFSSLKAVDVIAYLAFHRHGVDADQIKTWVWPPFDPPTDKAFANVMSRARTGLGAGDDGQPYLSRAGADKTYRLDQAVTTDFDRVRALGELAENADDPAITLRLLKQALELIRGVPFTGGTATSFAWSDNHVRAQVEYTIDELVHRCADLALEQDDLPTARWAALKGLELVPGCEQCFRRRFLIAGAGNNRNELRRAMADLEAASMIDLGEPEAVDCISGELIDLYHEVDRTLVAGRA